MLMFPPQVHEEATDARDLREGLQDFKNNVHRLCSDLSMGAPPASGHRWCAPDSTARSARVLLNGGRPAGSATAENADFPAEEIWPLTLRPGRWKRKRRNAGNGQSRTLALASAAGGGPPEGPAGPARRQRGGIPYPPPPRRALRQIASIARHPLFPPTEAWGPPPGVGCEARPAALRQNTHGVFPQGVGVRIFGEIYRTGVRVHAEHNASTGRTHAVHLLKVRYCHGTSMRYHIRQHRTCAHRSEHRASTRRTRRHLRRST